MYPPIVFAEDQASVSRAPLRPGSAAIFDAFTLSPDGPYPYVPIELPPGGNPRLSPFEPPFPRYSAGSPTSPRPSASPTLDGLYPAPGLSGRPYYPIIGPDGVPLNPQPAGFGAGIAAEGPSSRASTPATTPSARDTDLYFRTGYTGAPLAMLGTTQDTATHARVLGGGPGASASSIDRTSARRVIYRGRPLVPSINRVGRFVNCF